MLAQAATLVSFNPMVAGGGHTWYLKYFSPLVLYDVNFTKIQGELAEVLGCFLRRFEIYFPPSQRGKFP